MRRVLVMAILSAPAVAAAAVSAGPNQVVEIDNFSAVTGFSYVNAAQCADSQANPLVQLEWQIPAFTTGGTYKVVASNTAPSASTTPPNTCPDTDDVPTQGVRAGSVDSTSATLPVQQLAVAGSLIVSRSGSVCTGADENKEVFVCVHWDSPTQNKAGVATGRFRIQTAAPSPPTGVSASPADGRLIVRWTASTGSTLADRYFARATPVGGGTSADSATTNGTTVDIGGLTNNTTYDVVVFAVSIGGNASAASAAAQGTPLPSDNFWEFYRNQSGANEQGGCASGGAGALALLFVAAGLVLSRRRK
jgi:uncharacterized protein (TIGR03382 family)